MEKRRVVVAGIDGGEFSVLKRMIGKGLMPNLDSIMKTGCAEDIDTSVKGHGQGWASFITGKSPEKHGVFYWNLYARLVNSGSFKDKVLWEILGEQGIRSCVINMSYTYPPKPFNGYMISGLGSGLNASDKLELSYPEGLLEEVKSSAGDYIPACDYKEGTTDDHLRLIEKIIRMTEYRTKACLYIMEKHSPEFVLNVFRGADLIQHCYWNLLEQGFKVSEGNRPLQSLIESYYRKLDGCIARIFAQYHDSTNIIVSDHGFGPVKAIVHLNHYLAERGFLSRLHEGGGRSMATPYRLGRSALKFIYRNALANYGFFRRLNRIRTEMNGMDLPVDKRKTLASSDVLFGVNLNRQSPFLKNPEKVKRDIIKCLRDFRDPRTNDKVIEKAYLKENSHAMNVKGAPEIIFESNESYIVSSDMPPGDDRIFRYMDAEETSFFTGGHRRSGIFIMNGKDTAGTAMKRDINITDVFATILDIFNIAIPHGVDGRPILKSRGRSSGTRAVNF